jgi:hypothetical protein
MLVLADPKSHVTTSVSDEVQATQMMVNYGAIPILPNGRAAQVQSFEGGYLVQGAPLNVWLKGVWLTGQKEILTPFWQNGTIPTPALDQLNMPIVDAAPEVLQAYANYKGVPDAKSLTEAYQTGGGVSTPVLLAGAAILGFLFLRK